MGMEEIEIPLFPLNTVLFPGGPLPLRIFEARYLDMVSDCLRNDRPFGVCLISAGAEAGSPAETVAVGTLARIVDWSQLEGGLLGVTARGERRFELLARQVRPDRLIIGAARVLPDEEGRPVPGHLQALAALLTQFMEHVGGHYRGLETRYDDAAWVSYRLCELLPIPLARKQYFLELQDPVQRLEQLSRIVASIAESRA
jgi:Lon protease-like protein